MDADDASADASAAHSGAQTSMRALVLLEQKDRELGAAAPPYSVEVQHVRVPHVGRDEVLVRLTHGALNRRDHWILRGLYPGISFPSVIGADGVGTLVAAGPGCNGDTRQLMGKRVVIDPGTGWGVSEREPTYEYRIIGMQPDGGTFAEFIAVKASQVYEAPAHLTDEEAAALPLAGVTAFRATITKGCVDKGHTVLVPGIGGGVALSCMQFALAKGARVFVTSSSPAKIERAKGLGAAGGVLYTDADWTTQLVDMAGSAFDAVIDGAGGDHLPGYFRVLKMGGIVASYGATNGPPKRLPLARMFLQNQELRGSTMGSPREFRAMLDLVTEHKIRPVVDCVLPLEEHHAAFEKLSKSSQFGKVVLACGPAPSAGAAAAAGVPPRSRL